METIKILGSPFITIEEVPQFVVCTMRKVQTTVRKKRQQKKIAAGAAGTAPDTDDDESLVTVRPWLRIVPELLRMGYQVDMRAVNAAHYGVPQKRVRIYICAALCGHPLPTPPAPRYHCEPARIQLGDDPCLLTFQSLAGLAPLVVTSDPGLPSAVTVREAIGDLPSLLVGGSLTRGTMLTLYKEGAAGLSRYQQYLRGCDSGLLSDHERHNVKGEQLGGLCRGTLPAAVLARQPQKQEPEGPRLTVCHSFGCRLQDFAGLGCALHYHNR